VEFQYPQPSDAMLASIYTDDYFLGSEDEDARSAMAALKSATARLYLQSIKALVKAPVPRLLEIGCGSGDFLVEAQSNGFDVEGLEYSPHAVSTANTRLSSEAVRVGSLETSNLPANAYDVAAAFDVIEHLRDPVSSLKKIYSSLKPGGILAIATPSLDSWSRHLLGSHWMEYKTEHLTYFGKRSLKLLLENLGFTFVEFAPNYKILSLDYISRHFGRFPVPLVGPAVRLARTVVPAKMAHSPLKIVASGTLAFGAKKPGSAASPA
jgi:SAM-dependent methyltransferase